MQHGDRVKISTPDSAMHGWVGTVIGPSPDFPGRLWVQLDITPHLPQMFRPDELEVITP